MKFFNLILTTISILSFNSILYSQIRAVTINGDTVQLNLDGTWIYLHKQNTPTSDYANLGTPYLNDDNQILSYSGFTIQYNAQHKQSSWVSYRLTREMTFKKFDRSNDFRPDLNISTGTATNKDFYGSGYDRGHLAPAADMSWSLESLSESFLYTNISPQNPGFNRGIWKRLEELVRSWAIEKDSIYVVTGPILKSELPSIGQNKVSAPNYFYKVIFDNKYNNRQAIGFLLKNENSPEDLKEFSVSVDSIEKLTGINFFYQFPDSIQKDFESKICKKCWTWDFENYLPEINNLPVSPVGYSTQCSGTTKLEDRCRNTTKNINGFCYLHQSQAR